MSSFWKKLPRPFLVLAPMEGVTDFVFREIMTDLPRPDVLVTEFTSADGICSAGREPTIQRFKYSSKQHPIVAQIWGTRPETLNQTAALVQELGFDGVDINMGCPDKSVMKQGAGGAMCKTPALAKEIIHAVKEGAPKIAVSVKTRLGFNKIITEEWIPFLLEQQVDALTIHGRTAKQRSNGSANWDEIGKAIAMRDTIAPETVIIGNGDIKSYKEALSAHEMHHVDGVMIGRGVFSNPWVFEKTVTPVHRDRTEYIAVLKKHLTLYVDTWGVDRHFDIMKKFFKMYVNNFPEAAQLRAVLMECSNKEEVLEALSKRGL